MAVVIYKYEIPPTMELVLPMPPDATAVHVGTQRGRPYVWIQHDTDAPKIWLNRYTVVGTGQRFEQEEAIHVGTFMLLEGDFVGHVYEECRPA